MNTTPRPRAAITSNGASDIVTTSLHIVIFSPSIVSDWQNPAATTVRAVMRALIADGHEVIHLEERRNQPTVDLLRARGSAGLRAFTERYADLPYRTYEMPSGVERTVWFVRQVSTADAVIIVDGTPTAVIELAAQLQTRHLTWIRWSSDPQLESSWADISVTPVAGDAIDQSSGAIALGPAVERLNVPSANERSGILLVAYDDGGVAEATRQAISNLGPTCLSAGSVSGDHWTFVPEAALADYYRQARIAVVAGTGDDPFAMARALLPVAVGCPTVAVTSLEQIETLHHQIVALPNAVPGTNGGLAEAFDAAIVARRLVDLVRVAQHRRLPHLA